MFPDLTAAIRADATLRGTLTANAPLAPLSWFKTGGPAQLLFEPADEEDLAIFLSALDPAVPVFVVGCGSNLLVRDGGVPGAVIHLGRELAHLAVDGARLTAGAGLADVKLAATAARSGLSGLAFFRGIPGSIGGALRMNAGAYGAETADVFVAARGVDRRGTFRVFNRAAMGFAYRHSVVPDDVVFTSAVFEGRPGEPEAIAAEMSTITRSRAASQPVNARTGGSTFKNPPGRKAWELVDQAGCRGLRQGGAQVSPLHCNFLVNVGGATAADLETLGETVRRRVADMAGVMLEWEIKRIGRPGA